METVTMTPAPGERLVRFVGDRLAFTLELKSGNEAGKGLKAFLRTNLGRAARRRHEIIHAHTGRLGLAASSWRDIPMVWKEDRWVLDLALSEVGFFQAKAYMADSENRQHWVGGADFGVTVHPDDYRSNNTIYCAFARMFGASKTKSKTIDLKRESVLKAWDKKGFTVIPPSGRFRDLIADLPHIIDTLGCRILHLLPVNPTPTTYARFGRFGSPYACQDLLAIDPALVEFDKRTTGIDQFRELTYATHLKGGRVFLDVVINHTGWGSTLQENHPEWFVRDEEDNFVSPGAWGNIWEDLTELHHRNPALWENLGDVFLEWCRRGVDGFRCDAGYKIPVPAWRYITARVQEEFPETIFLLEGLGGSWEATENLLTEGGMQWAYSELFQNYNGKEVSSYLDYSIEQSRRVGMYVHYSETHDNDRLAKKGKAWSLLRNRLCALTSVGGGFGFTCGVEWLAPEKLNVHSSRGLAWGSKENLLPELTQLNSLLSEHPCFYDNAVLTRLSPDESSVLAMSRESFDGQDHVLILVNTSIKAVGEVEVSGDVYEKLGRPGLDLLSLNKVAPVKVTEKGVVFKVKAGGSHCMAVGEKPRGLHGEDYRLTRARSAWAIHALSQRLACEAIGPFDWNELADELARDPVAFLASIDRLDSEVARQDLLRAIRESQSNENGYPNVIHWCREDAKRITVVPPNHWILVEQSVPFRAALRILPHARHERSIQIGDIHYAAFPPGLPEGDVVLELERYDSDRPDLKGMLRIVGEDPVLKGLELSTEAVAHGLELPNEKGVALLTNQRGGMARMQVDLGEVQSKYDCVLGANLHKAVPVDRHIFLKRIRVWVVANGFITALNGKNLIGFSPGPPAEWRFVTAAGDGRAVEIHMVADMLPDQNTTVLRFCRPKCAPAFGLELPASAHVSLTVRPDLLDRNFHYETQRNDGLEYHFQSNLTPLPSGKGFCFNPAEDRGLKVWTDLDRCQYHEEPEWSMEVEHKVEESRGQVAREDVFSPGWFEMPLESGEHASLVFDAEQSSGSGSETGGISSEDNFIEQRRAMNEAALEKADLEEGDVFGWRLVQAIQAFVVRRDDARTVIAGYPWFLDWGRDSLICARGLLAAGLFEEVRQLLIAFGRFAEGGTLPNSIHGNDASNRETSDAPLWYGIVAEELAERIGPDSYETRVNESGRTIRDVLVQIAEGYVAGTTNGIHCDAESGLIWSPSHYTWMDTNYPAGTPREGYPVEIQALWIRLCRQLSHLQAGEDRGTHWSELAERTEDSLNRFFWMEKEGYLADLLRAGKGQTAGEAVLDNSLRSNCLLAVSLGIIIGLRAKRCVGAAMKHLVVPGAIRSLAPLPVTPPLPVHGADGTLLNNPDHPYWGHYEGDEDTRRKPAYHNGTAWTWPFPGYCEALAKAWDWDEAAVGAARAYLGSMDRLMVEGCLGHLPEIVDGDTPHKQRGCDAQAWGATEALRVWKLLNQG